MIGKKFNHLTIVSFSHKEKIIGHNGFNHFWKFNCDCGNVHTARLNAVKCGQTKSCGCLNKILVKKINTTHGMSYTRFYKIWSSILSRCNNPLASKYNNYGGRGIRVLWQSFEQFKNDMYESYLEHCKTFGDRQTTIDRIDGNDNYYRENCRWATYREQNNNLKSNLFYTYNGETLCLSAWANKIGICSQGLKYRLKKYDNNIELAIKNPILYKK